MGNCSIFFNEIWKSVSSWRYDNDAFPSELKDMVRLCHLCTKLISSDLCVTLIIEILSLLHLLLQPGSQLSAEFAHENGIGTHLLTTGITHGGYKSIYSQWHHKIGSAAIGCLKSSKYMHTRAAIIVLSHIEEPPFNPQQWSPTKLENIGGREIGCLVSR